MDENKIGLQQEEDEADDGFVTLLDGDGNEHRFEHLDTFLLNGETYVVFVPATEDDETEAEEVVLFTVGEDEKGNEAFLLVEDEAELDMAFEEFKKRMDNEFDFE